MSDTSPDREERIRARAYEMWEAEGRQEGKAEHYWHRAREEMEPPSGSLDDQLADTFPASDPPSMTSPSYPEEPLPAVPQDEALPARSATVEERPEPAPAKPAKSGKPKPPPKSAAQPAAAQPATTQPATTQPAAQPTPGPAAKPKAKPAPRGKA
ncbi:DUF2934 domain-containing protein [Teichococcus aestuarii]|uniref:DUF2934 domain-containing protein n=1 Tax=Teichococcus aestuarii TaxID=568898 RepID=UPI00360B8868